MDTRIVNQFEFFIYPFLVLVFIYGILVIRDRYITQKRN